jgi:prepilin-type processing-associated H-X9-DG protein
MNYPRPDRMTILRVTWRLWSLSLNSVALPSATPRSGAMPSMETQPVKAPLVEECLSSFFACLFFLPILIWLVLCVGGGVYLLTQIMHPLLGIPLGVLVGYIVFIILLNLNIMENGNSLVEVGIGFTIPLVLGMILLPVFAQARDKARQATCLTNLRMLGQASLTYAADFDEAFPPAERWADALSPYLSRVPRKHEKQQEITSRDVLQCPTDRNRFSYAFNDAVTQLSAVPKQGTRWGEEARTPLLFESSAHQRNAHDRGTSLVCPPRHNSGNNFLYADGHARLEKTPPQEKRRLVAER